MNKFAVLLCVPAALVAEVRTMTLREAIEVAARQNPTLLAARLDRVKSQLSVDIARDPFMPKVYAGSGAAWTSGFPISINGDPPAILQAKTIMSLYNRSQSIAVAQARENVRTSDLDFARQQDDIVFRVAALFLDAAQAGRAAAASARQADSLQKIADNVAQRVAEGRELAIQSKRATLDVARARQQAEALAGDRDTAEESLALTLGFPAGDRVRPGEGGSPPEVPDSEEAAVSNALANNNQIKVIESQMQSKGLEEKAYLAQRLPSVDLVAQYAMLSRQNFESIYGSKYQRNNGELGASFTIPLVVGKTAKAQALQARADRDKLRIQHEALRNQVEADSRKAYRDIRRAEAARQVAKLELEVAREQLSIVEAQYDEGRASIRDLEVARVQESEKSIAYYQTQNEVERARLNLLRQTGTLSASLR